MSTLSQASTTRPALADVFITPTGPNGDLMEQLYGGDFLANGENVIIFGPPGCAKGFFARLIARANSKTNVTMMADMSDLHGLDIKEPIVFVGGAFNKPSTLHGLRPELVDCDVLILDGLADPERNTPSYCEQLSKLFKVRADAKRSTIVLVTADTADRNLLGQRFPVTLEGPTWHVLEMGYPDAATERRILEAALRRSN